MSKKCPHFAKCCFKKDTYEIEQNSSEKSDVCHNSDSSSSSFFVGSVESKQADEKPDSKNGSDTPCDPNNVYTCDDTQNSEWKISLQSNGSDIEYKIDTGAQVNVLPYEQYLRLQKKPKLHKMGIQLSAYNGTSIPVSGRCILNVVNK